MKVRVYHQRLFMVIIVFMAEAWSSSKGENIVLNISKLASELGQFV